MRGTPVLLSSLQRYLELQKHFEGKHFNGYAADHPVRVAALDGLWAVQRAILAAGALPYSNHQSLQSLPYGRVFDSIPDEEPLGAPARTPSPPRVHRPSVMHADERGDTALHLASQAGHTDAVRAMVSGAPALIDKRNRQGGTALMAASNGGHMASVRALLAAGAGVGVVDAEGRGALWWAHGRWEVVRELVSQGEGVDEASKGAVLARALQQNWDEVAQVLRGEEVRDRFGAFGM